MPQKERTITNTFYNFSYRQQEDSDNCETVLILNILLLVLI